MVNFERPTGSIAPGAGAPAGPAGGRIPPSELIRQKMAEMPKEAPTKTPSVPQAIKPRGRINIFSIINLLLVVGLAAFTLFIFSSTNSKINSLKSLIGAESPELKTQQEKLALLERTLTEFRTETDTKTKALEDKITGTTGFASSADLETLKNILKTTDSDKDGLSDYDEVVTYKSNPNLRDSDGDGFQDKAEVDAGYNPNGPGRLQLTEQPTAEQKTIIKVNTSNYKFEPSTIEVKVGEDVRIELTSVDTAHTFTIDALNIDHEVKAGGTEIIEFKPDKAGEYTFYSNKPNDIRNKMEGKLIVK